MIRFDSGNAIGLLLRGSLWTTAGSLASKILNGVTVVFIARTLGLESFGDFSLSRQTIGLFALLASLGLSASISRLVAFSTASKSESTRPYVTAAFAVSGMLVVISGAALTSTAPFLANDLGRPDLVEQIRSAGLLVVTGAPLGVARGALQGLGRFGLAAASSFIEGVVALVLVAPLAGGLGPAGGFLALAGGQLAALLVAAYSLRSHWRPWRPWNSLKAVGQQLLSTAVPVFLASSLHGPTMWLFYRQISRGAERTSEATGILGAGEQVAVIVALLPDAIARVAMPLIASLLTAREELASLRRRAVQFQFLLALLIGFVLFAGRGLVPRALGPDFEPVVDLMGLFCVYGIIRATVHAGMMDLMAHGRTWLMLTIGLGWALVLLLANSALLASYGVEGSVWALILAATAQGLLVVLLSWRTNGRDHGHGARGGSL